MMIHRRILKKTRTVERTSIFQNENLRTAGTTEDQKFRVEIFDEFDQMQLTFVFVGKIEIKELSDGVSHIVGGCKIQITKLFTKGLGEKNE